MNDRERTTNDAPDTPGDADLEKAFLEAERRIEALRRERDDLLENSALYRGGSDALTSIILIVIGIMLGATSVWLFGG